MSEELKNKIYAKLLGIVDEMNALVGMIEQSRDGKSEISVDKKTADIGKIIFEEEVIEA